MSIALDVPCQADPSFAPESLGAERPATARIRVVVQQRQRLFREGISNLLGAEADVEVVAMAHADVDLLAACRQHRPSVAVIEADVSEWDTLRLVASLRRISPSIGVVGLTASPAAGQEATRLRRAGMAPVSRHTGIKSILDAIRSPAKPPAPTRGAPIRRAESTSLLTGRELEVLSLVGAGLTSSAASARLGISHKTVENHKQRIFAKLGVQNQAHAVSVALRTGLMRPERVIDLVAAPE